MFMSEPQIRLAAFILAFLLLTALELWLPAARMKGYRQRRWTVNLSMAVLNTLLLRLFAPLIVLAGATWQAQFGSSPIQISSLPAPLALLLSLLALDLVMYAQHRAFHRFPMLWRVHRAHHSDLHLDVTTGLRFHPLEMVPSLAIKLGVVVLLGIAPAAVFVFELLLSVASLYSHSNFRLHPMLDAALVKVLITPAMHRVHHSLKRRDADSNYGAIFSFWDRLFGSYHDHDATQVPTFPLGAGDLHLQQDMTDIRDLLMLPFQPARAPRQTPADADKAVG